MGRQIEKRAHVRYTLSEGAIALCANHPGHIKDISLGGLAFVSLEPVESSSAIQTVDILDGQNGFFLEQVPCRMLDDTVILNDSPFNTIHMVKRRLQFEGLTETQKTKLQIYLQAHAAEKLPLFS